jgi:hypothetical protein
MALEIQAAEIAWTGRIRPAIKVAVERENRKPATIKLHIQDAPGKILGPESREIPLQGLDLFADRRPTSAMGAHSPRPLAIAWSAAALPLRFIDRSSQILE